ncbi:hypothetical protein ACIA8R_51245 [Nonomuraea sp. NPDC051191]|uniref:hypothetical protein n=1 Tax=Nonomuraea sp. NPDC051191 TaxID=3364372 RepID=UPI003791F1DC
MHGELATLGITVAPSTVWEILKQEGVDPAPERASVTWADFLRSQAEALLACDFIETVTLTGQRQYILAVIEHASRRVRVLGTTAHPTASWVVQAMRSGRAPGARTRNLRIKRSSSSRSRSFNAGQHLYAVGPERL